MSGHFRRRGKRQEQQIALIRKLWEQPVATMKTPTTGSPGRPVERGLAKTFQPDRDLPFRARQYPGSVARCTAGQGTDARSRAPSLELSHPFRRGFGRVPAAPESRTIPGPAAAELLKTAFAPKGQAGEFSPNLLTLLYNGQIRLCVGPPARPMGPKPPSGGNPRPPVPHPVQMGPGTRAGSRDPGSDAWASGSGGAIRWEGGVRGGACPSRARARGGSTFRRTRRISQCMSLARACAWRVASTAGNWRDRRCMSLARACA
jgi:hypothetical protein